jgi:ketosteroid isomerase-like protein
MLKYLLIACAFVPLSVYAAEEPDHAIHQELRAVLDTLQVAINSGNFDAMLPVVSQNIRATPINQEVLSSHQDVTAYFKKWFGPGGYLKKLDMKLEPDALTELSADKTWGLVRGSGLERYTLADGRPYDLKTRWTATVVKETDGKWRLRSIHIGTNFLDNPILTQAERAVVKYAAVAAAVGLVLGLPLGFVFGRRKK